MGGGGGLVSEIIIITCINIYQKQELTDGGTSKSRTDKTLELLQKHNK